MSGLHDYTKYLKRGYGRTTDHTTNDVRAGLMTREEAFKLIRAIDPKSPKILKYYLKITGLSEKDFYRIMKTHRVGKAKKLNLS